MQVLPTGAEILKCLVPMVVSCSVLHVMKSFSGLQQEISHQSKAYQNLVCEAILNPTVAFSETKLCYNNLLSIPVTYAHSGQSQDS